MKHLERALSKRFDIFSIITKIWYIVLSRDEKMTGNMRKEEYDFTSKDPKTALTQDELAHFDEGMRLKNESKLAVQVDFARAARSVASDLDRLLS